MLQSGNQRVLPTYCIMAIATMYTAMVVQYSMHYGRLTTEVQYDDVSYYTNALSRLDEIPTGGLRSIVVGWIEHPPHSPYATLMAMCGFAIFGLQDWAPVAMNGLGVFVALLVIERLFRRQGPILVSAAMLFWLSSPLAINGATHFRPDFIAGLFSALGTLHAARLFSRMSDKNALWGGVFFGLAMLSKTSTFPLTAILLTTSLGVSFVTEFIVLRRRLAWSLLTRPLSRFFIPLLLLALPHYLIAFESISGYIYATLFKNDSAEIWRLRASFFEHFIFFLNGHGARFNLGVFALWIYPTVLCSLAGIARFWHQRQRALYMLGLLVVITVNWSVISLNHHKTQFFGISFYVLLFFYFFLCLRFAVHRFRGSMMMTRALRPAIAMACIAPMFLLTPSTFVETYSRDSAKITYANDAYKDLMQLLATVAPPRREKPLHVELEFTHVVNKGRLRWLCAKRKLNVQFEDNYLETDMRSRLLNAEDADLVLVTTNRITESHGRFPSSHIQDELRRALETDHRFKQVMTVEAVPGIPTYVFQNVRGPMARRDVSQFGISNLQFGDSFYLQEEDVSTSWRWCSGSGQIEFTNNSDESLPLSVSIKLQAFQPREIKVSVNDRTFDCSLRDGEITESGRFSFAAQPGTNAIKFKTNRPGICPNNGDQRNLAFRVFLPELQLELDKNADVKRLASQEQNGSLR